MNKRFLFAVSLISLISLSSCSPRDSHPQSSNTSVDEGPAETDKQTFFDEAAKIEEFKYDYAIVHIKEIQHISVYDESDNHLIDSDEITLEYSDLYFHFTYEPMPEYLEPEDGKFDLYYQVDYDREKSNNQDIGSVETDVINSLFFTVNLQNDRYIHYFCNSVYSSMAKFYLHPFTLVIGFGDEQALGYRYEYEEHGFPQKTYGKTYAASGSGQAGEETRYTQTDIEIWLDARYE